MPARTAPVAASGNRPSLAPVWLAAAAFLVVVAFLAWAFAQPGTLGMYRWGYRLPVLGLLGLGTVPLVLAIGAALATRHGLRGAGVLVAISSALAVTALLAGTGVSLYVLSRAYGRLPAAELRPRVLDPTAGIAPRIGPDGSSALRVAISSDPHFDRDVSAHEATRAILSRAGTQARAGELDAFIVLGDFVEMGMESSGWDAVLDGFRQAAPDLPLLALMGNHDALVGGARRWRAAVGPRGGSARVPDGALSASSWPMDAGPVHFIALDLLWGPEGFGPREKAWLAARLDSIPTDEYAVVLTHSFFYSSGYVDAGTGKDWFDHEAMLREVAPLLAGKADLVVSGHNH